MPTGWGCQGNGPSAPGMRASRRGWGPLLPPGGAGGPLSSLQAPPHYSHQGRTQVEGHGPQHKHLPEAGGGFQAGRLQMCAPLACAHFTAEDPRLRRVGGQMVGGVCVADASTETKVPAGTTPPHLGNQRRWVGPISRVPTLFPQPHLRQEEERAGQGRELNRVGLVLRQPVLTEGSPAWRTRSPAGRVVAAGPLHKRPTVSLAGRLFLKDFRKKRGTGDSHSAPQEPEVVHKGALLLAEARPAPHAA